MNASSNNEDTVAKNKAEAINTTKEQLELFKALFDSLHKAVIEHETTSQLIQYWDSTQQDHQMILNNPAVASSLIDYFFVLALRLITGDVEYGSVFASRIYINAFFLMQCFVSVFS